LYITFLNVFSDNVGLSLTSNSNAALRLAANGPAHQSEQRAAFSF